MPAATAVLKSRSFWLWLYRQDDDAPLDGNVLRNFTPKQIGGREYAEAVISLPCGAGHEIELSILPDFRSVNLGLRNLTTNVVAEIGWWDDARWHPHALRWDELVKLREYWHNALDSSIHPSAAFLLLALFVGHGVDEQQYYAERKTTICEHYKRLDLFTDSEVDNLSNATLIIPSEDDYVWRQDKELGWVFGGDYPCYSLRNRAHADGSEGRFPFAEWTAIVAQL